MNRAIIAEFLVERGGRILPRLFNLTVVRDFVCSDGRVVRSKDQYDVNWHRNGEYYLFHKSGMGGAERVKVMGNYFTSGPAIVRETKATWCHRPDPTGRRTRDTRRRNRTRRMSTLPEHIDLRPGEDLLDWLENHNVQQDAVWCSECCDHVRGDELCKHCWWCEKNGWYSTPSERCGHNRGECDEWR